MNKSLLLLPILGLAAGMSSCDPYYAPGYAGDPGYGPAYGPRYEPGYMVAYGEPVYVYGGMNYYYYGGRYCYLEHGRRVYVNQIPHGAARYHGGSQGFGGNHDGHKGGPGPKPYPMNGYKPNFQGQPNPNLHRQNFQVQPNPNLHGQSLQGPLNPNLHGQNLQGPPNPKLHGQTLQRKPHNLNNQNPGQGHGNAPNQGGSPPPSDKKKTNPLTR